MKQNIPRVSVILPNYNHEFFLVQRLKSIFNQSFHAFEVILLDDCSTDESRNILSEYANHPKVSHCIFNNENSGSTFKQWEKGINLAKGEFVWIAESDDFCEDTFLEQLLKPHFTNSGLALSFCQSHKMAVDGEVTGNWITHTSEYGENIFRKSFEMGGNEFIEKYLIHKNVVPNVSAVLFKKKALQKITPLVFEPFMKYNADWFYYVQLLCNSKVAFVAETLNYFRYHENSVIGKAGGESGWLKIYEMELQGRMKMMCYLEKAKPSNLEKIRQEGDVGNFKLENLIIMRYLDEENYGRALKHSSRSPKFLKIILHFLMKRFYKRMILPKILSRNSGIKKKEK